jgi:hypothetical protein
VTEGDSERSINGWLPLAVMGVAVVALLISGLWYLVFPERVRKYARNERRERFPDRFHLVNIPANTKSRLFVPMTRAIGIVYLVLAIFLVYILFLLLRGE